VEIIGYRLRLNSARAVALGGTLRHVDAVAASVRVWRVLGVLALAIGEDDHHFCRVGAPLLEQHFARGLQGGSGVGQATVVIEALDRRHDLRAAVRAGGVELTGLFDAV